MLQVDACVMDAAQFMLVYGRYGSGVQLGVPVRPPPAVRCVMLPRPQVLTVIINVFIWDKHASPEGIACLMVW